MDGRYWDEALETRPWAEVERWQAGQVAACLPGVRGRSPMYAEMLAGVSAAPEFRSFAALAELPFTTKEHIRAAQDAATDSETFGRNQAAPSGAIVQAICSSGTTGRPLYYALTRSDCEMFADAIANTWYTAGVRNDDIVAHLVGLPMVAGGLPYADGFRRIGATLVWLGGFPTDRILREMRRLRCSALLATTSFGLYLSGLWDGIGLEVGVPSRLRTVLCGGEPGMGQADIRDRIARGLGASRLREVMGLGDVIPAMWAECEEQDGMHFNAQRYIAIELLDPASGAVLPWTDGARGEVVYTAFVRDATPVLRYRSRDHILVTGTTCRCGRTSPRIRCVGRTDDMLIYKGMNVFPSAINDFILGRFAAYAGPHLRIWKESAEQVRFDDPIAIDVEVSPELGTVEQKRLAGVIEEAVRVQLQVRVTVSLVPRGSVPRSVYKNSLLAIREQTRN